METSPSENTNRIPAEQTTTADVCPEQVQNIP